MRLTAESSGSPSDFPFPGRDRPGFLSQHLFCALKGKTANQLRYKGWSPRELCTSLKCYFLTTAEWYFLSFSYWPYLWGMGSLVRSALKQGDILGCGRYLMLIQREHCESFVLLRVCEEGCAERRSCPGWSKGSEADLVDDFSCLC